MFERCSGNETASLHKLTLNKEKPVEQLMDPGDGNSGGTDAALQSDRTALSAHHTSELDI